MNEDLAYLPERKRADLQRIAEIICEHCPSVGLIVLFGSYARGDWKESKDLAPDRKSGHVSDYDILAITERGKECDSLVWQEIDVVCRAAGLSATARIIHHDISFVNRKLELGQYFFSDIIAEGKGLYDSGVLKLAERRDLTPQERLEVAQEDFATWFESAEDFHEIATYSISKAKWKKAAFLLHQTAEASFKAVLLLFNGYIPDEHYLGLLGGKAADIEPAFHEFFRTSNAFESDALTALEYAYIGARYDRRYTIDESAVLFLADRVAELLRLTGERCREKILALEKAAGG